MAKKKDPLLIKRKVLYPSQLEERDRHLTELLKGEKNKRERARMEDEQGAIRFVLRSFPARTIKEAITQEEEKI